MYHCFTEKTGVRKTFAKKKNTDIEKNQGNASVYIRLRNNWSTYMV